MARRDGNLAERSLARAVAELGRRDFPSHLAGFLHHCAPFDNCIVLAYRGEEHPRELYREFKDPVVYHAMDSEYVTGAYLLDPFFRAHLERIPAGLYRLLDIAPDQFRRTAYFQAYYQKTTLIDEVAAFGYTPGGYTINVCLGTDRSSGRFFPKQALAKLRRFEAVIVALIERHWADFAPDEEPSPPGLSRHDPPLLERLMRVVARRQGVTLSRRQAEVALLILQGHSSESIGLLLGISPQTVKVFRKQLYARCAVTSQAELFALMMPLMAEASSEPG